MRILVISDTHGAAESLKLVLKKEEEFDCLFHCGDMEGQENYIRETAKCPCYMVMGNNDWGSQMNREILTTVDDYRIFVTHGHRYRVSLGTESLWDEAYSRKAQICLFGHTHRPYLESNYGLTLMNPGSLCYPRQMKRVPTYGVIEIDRNHEAHFFIRQLDL